MNIINYIRGIRSNRQNRRAAMENMAVVDACLTFIQKNW